jgi:hypothetical protein
MAGRVLTQGAWQASQLLLPELQQTQTAFGGVVRSLSGFASG